MLGFHVAHHTLVGLQLPRMIKKEQRAGPEDEALSAAKQFYASAS